MNKLYLTLDNKELEIPASSMDEWQQAISNFENGKATVISLDDYPYKQKPFKNPFFKIRYTKTEVEKLKKAVTEVKEGSFSSFVTGIQYGFVWTEDDQGNKLS